MPSTEQPYLHAKIENSKSPEAFSESTLYCENSGTLVPHLVSRPDCSSTSLEHPALKRHVSFSDPLVDTEEFPFSRSQIYSLKSDIVPQSSESATRSSEIVPDSSEILPVYSKIASISSKIAPISPESASTSEIVPQFSDVVPRPSEIVPQSSETIPQSSDVAPLSWRAQAVATIKTTVYEHPLRSLGIACPVLIPALVTGYILNATVCVATRVAGYAATQVKDGLSEMAGYPSQTVVTATAATPTNATTTTTALVSDPTASSSTAQPDLQQTNIGVQPIDIEDQPSCRTGGLASVYEDIQQFSRAAASDLEAAAMRRSDSESTGPLAQSDEEDLDEFGWHQLSDGGEDLSPSPEFDRPDTYSDNGGIDADVSYFTIWQERIIIASDFACRVVIFSIDLFNYSVDLFKRVVKTIKYLRNPGVFWMQIFLPFLERTSENYRTYG